MLQFGNLAQKNKNLQAKLFAGLFSQLDQFPKLTHTAAPQLLTLAEARQQQSNNSMSSCCLNCHCYRMVTHETSPVFERQAGLEHFED